MGIEHFFTHWEYTIQALGAAGTVAAVIISLLVAFQARRESRTHLKVYLDVMTAVPGTRSGPEYLVVTIVNTGGFPVSIPRTYFSWEVPIHRGSWLVYHPLDGSPTALMNGHPNVPRQAYPVEISRERRNPFIWPTWPRSGVKSKG